MGGRTGLEEGEGDGGVADDGGTAAHDATAGRGHADAQTVGEAIDDELADAGVFVSGSNWVGVEYDYLCLVRG